MASTPPPLPSSDEGEFDDDDFGGFTSSAPVRVDSESETDAHNSQASIVSPINAHHSIAISGDGTDITDDVCNEKELHFDQPDDEPPEFYADSITTLSESKLKVCPSVQESSPIEAPSLDTSVNLDANSQFGTATLNDSCLDPDSADVGEHVAEFCPNESHNGVEDVLPEVDSSQQVANDWAAFSSTPNDSSHFSQADKLKDVTEEQNVNESFQAFDEKDGSVDQVCVSATVVDGFDSHSGVLESENNKEIVNKIDEPIDNQCDSSNNGHNDSHEIVENNIESRSDNGECTDENDSGPELDNDSNAVSESKSVPEMDVPINETNNCLDTLDRELTNESGDNNVIDDDDDYGDFSDFESTKDIQSSLKDDVAPISFRSSICEDDLVEEEEDHNGFNNGIAFETQTDRPGGSPPPFGDDEEEQDEDWGFKGAGDNPSEIEEAGDEFGDFGSINQGTGDDADWADFSESAAPNTIISEDVDFPEQEFQSASTKATVSTPVSSLQLVLSKFERAIASSFPHEHQMHFLECARRKKKADLSQSESGDDKAAGDSSINSLGSVIEMGLKAVPEAKQETWTITRDIRIKDPMVGIWERLRDVNACHALNFGWGSSQCSQDVYNTLHIDTKNVLFSQKKQAVPFFASGLGILEPIRGASTQPEKQNVSPPLLETESKEQSQTEILQDIPPVDFDWSSSGLTDPLKVFKADTFNTGLSSFEPFAEILQKNAAASQGSSDKELSTEAKSFLKKIPILSFMQSKVLMFPMKDP